MLPAQACHQLTAAAGVSRALPMLRCICPTARRGAVVGLAVGRVLVEAIGSVPGGLEVGAELLHETLDLGVGGRVRLVAGLVHHFRHFTERLDLGGIRGHRLEYLDGCLDFGRGGNGWSDKETNCDTGYDDALHGGSPRDWRIGNAFTLKFRRCRRPRLDAGNGRIANPRVCRSVPRFSRGSDACGETAAPTSTSPAAWDGSGSHRRAWPHDRRPAMGSDRR